MTAFAQSISNNSSTTGLTFGVAYSTQNLTPGSLLVAVALWDLGAGSTCTLADSANTGAWTAIGSPVTGVSGQGLFGLSSQMFFYPGNRAATKPTVTMTVSASNTFFALALLEYTGTAVQLQSASFIEEHAATTSKTVSLTPRTANDVMVATLIASGSTPTTGAPFTQREFVNFASNPVSDDTVTTPGSALTCTFNAISTGTENFVGAALFTPAVPSITSPSQAVARAANF